jgi:spermidine/putrescine transport system permease protein
VGFLHRHQNLTPYLLLAPGLLYLGLFFVVPLGFLAYQSLESGTFDVGYAFDWAWGNYWDAIQNYRGHFLRSLEYAGIATIVALLLGYPLAYWIAFRGGRWKNLLLLFIVAPFFVTYLIRTLAWETILSDQGPVVSLLRDIHVLGPDGRLLATSTAVVAGITYNFFPFMALPLSLPGVVAGTLLTFIPAAGDFINAQLLGSPRTHMIGNVIQSKFLELTDYPAAASMSFVLMAAILVMVAVYARAVGTEKLTG